MGGLEYAFDDEAKKFLFENGDVVNRSIEEVARIAIEGGSLMAERLGVAMGNHTVACFQLGREFQRENLNG